jgi:hypothetical protein
MWALTESDGPADAARSVFLRSYGSAAGTQYTREDATVRADGKPGVGMVRHAGTCWHCLFCL